MSSISCNQTALNACGCRRQLQDACVARMHYVPAAQFVCSMCERDEWTDVWMGGWPDVCTISRCGIVLDSYETGSLGQSIALHGTSTVPDLV